MKRGNYIEDDNGTWKKRGKRDQEEGRERMKIKRGRGGKRQINKINAKMKDRSKKQERKSNLK